MSKSKFRYKAFISYSHADSVWAEWLLKALESYRIPKNLVGRVTDIGPIPPRLAPVFRDRDELPATHRLTDRLFQALRSSEFLVVLCSPYAAKSKLVNKEIIEFKKTHGDGRVLSMIVDGTPFAEDPADECFPEALRHSFLKDGSHAGLSAEGLAADVRPEGDGKRMGLIKIVAGMIGVGLNDIVQRDEQQRNRNLTAVTATAIIAMSLMAVLTYQALNARDTATKAQAQIAEQLNQNDELIHDFMDTAYSRLLEHGNLDTLEKITTRMLESYRSRDIATLPPQYMFHYTGAMLRFGQNLDRQGHGERARVIFEEVRELSSRFYESNPMLIEAIARYQLNLFFTGYLALRQGRIDDAVRDYRKRLELTEFALAHEDELLHVHAPNPELVMSNTAQVADVKMGLASILSGPLGRIDEAIPMHQSSIELYKKVVEARNGANNIVIQLASAYHYAAETYMLAGQMKEAEEAFQKRYAIFEAMLEGNPQNYRILRRLWMTKQSFAAIEVYRGNLEDAFTLYSEAAAGLSTLVEKDPANIMWLGDCAKAFVDKTEIAFRLGRWTEAEEALKIGTEQIAKALAHDDTRPKRWLTHHRAMALGARLAQARGDTDHAMQEYSATIEALSQKGPQYFTIVGTREQEAKTLLALGRLLAANGKHAEAQKHWQVVVGNLTGTKASITLAGKDTLANAHYLLGNHSQAAALSNELNQLGYRGSDFSAISEAR